MTIGEKAKNLVNPAKWVQGFMLNKFLKRLMQCGATAVVALLASNKFQETLTAWGNGDLPSEKVLAGVASAVVAGVIGGLMNTAKHGPLKTENDDPDGPPASE